jgi:hypothetical protein
VIMPPIELPSGKKAKVATPFGLTSVSAVVTASFISFGIGCPAWPSSP